MANEHLAVQIEANGTLTLTDRKTRRTYRDLLTFEERADIGDGWYHGVAVNDQDFDVDARHRDMRNQTIDHQYEYGEQDSVSQLGESERIS